jgi:sugar phosphate isomerase/epimerase
MRTTTISRRSFLNTFSATLGALGTARLLRAEPSGDNIQLGMMLQGSSVDELQKKARAIAAVGFERVQLTFFFEPTTAEIQSLAGTLKSLRLKVVAFGTYFNLLRPDDTGFMGANLSVMKRVATLSGMFGCNQFVTWSGSYATKFDGADPGNHRAEAIGQLHQAIRDLILPVLEPIGGRIAFEPYFPHVLGTVDSAKQVLAPFPSRRVGLLLDPPNFISPALYPKREEEMSRLFRELGDYIHLAHFKDMKLNATDQRVDLPGPGGGEMDYPLLIADIRKLGRPMPCIIEHINAEAADMKKTKAWVEKQL